MPSAKILVASALLAQSAFAHIGPGCESYQHGVGLFARDPAQEKFEARLRARHPEVQAKVLLGRDAERELQRRQDNGQKTYRQDLTSINSAAISGISSGTGYTIPTQGLPTVYNAGSNPPVKGAPALPAVSIVPSDWPALDRPVENAADDPNVQQWMSEIDMDNIPNWGPTEVGGCSNSSNKDALAQAGEKDRCWWTCGGCTRNTDVSFCPDKMTWGLSYDDGPSPYTPELLEYLDAAQLKSTFFAVGSRVISRPEMLQYEYMDGHQIAVHTWSHFPLTTLTNEQIVAEFGYSKKAIFEVLGVTPKYYRAPYGDADDRVRYIAGQMGLTQIVWTRFEQRTFDTEDYKIQGGTVNTTTVMTNFNSILSQASKMDTGFIVLEHDLYAAAVELAVNYVLPTALTMPGLTVKSVISCLGMDDSESYIETGTNSTTGLVPTTPVHGASGTGLVQNLKYTPVALGGGASGPVTTLGYTPSAGDKGNAGANGGSGGDNSGALSVATGAVSSLLLAAAVFLVQ